MIFLDNILEMLHKIDIKKQELISLHEILGRFFLNSGDANFFDRKNIKALFDSVQENGIEAALMEKSLV